jgi:small-conductance mechanosensitive channel
MFGCALLDQAALFLLLRLACPLKRLIIQSVSRMYLIMILLLAVILLLSSGIYWQLIHLRQDRSSFQRPLVSFSISLCSHKWG